MSKMLTGKSLLLVVAVVAMVTVSFGHRLPVMERFFDASDDGMTVTAPGQSGAIIAKKRYTVAMPAGGEYRDLDAGEETWFAIGALSEASADLRANGVAQAHFYQKRIFKLSVQLNVEPSDADHFYEAWLVDSSSNQRISLGHMRSRFGDARHFVQYEAGRDLTDYEMVEVTLESDDGNPQPATLIASGELKTRER